MNEAFEFVDVVVVDEGRLPSQTAASTAIPRVAWLTIRLSLILFAVSQTLDVALIMAKYYRDPGGTAIFQSLLNLGLSQTWALALLALFAFLCRRGRRISEALLLFSWLTAIRVFFLSVAKVFVAIASITSPWLQRGGIAKNVVDFMETISIMIALIDGFVITYAYWIAFGIVSIAVFIFLAYATLKRIMQSRRGA